MTNGRPSFFTCTNDPASVGVQDTPALKTSPPSKSVSFAAVSVNSPASLTTCASTSNVGCVVRAIHPWFTYSVFVSSSSSATTTAPTRAPRSLLPSLGTSASAHQTWTSTTRAMAMGRCARWASFANRSVLEAAALCGKIERDARIQIPCTYTDSKDR